MYIPIIPKFRRLRQEEQNFRASLSNRESFEVILHYVRETLKKKKVPIIIIIIIISSLSSHCHCYHHHIISRSSILIERVRLGIHFFLC